MNAFEILAARGFVKQHTAGAPALIEGDPAVFYVGFDPTGDSLHVGHLLPIMAMAHLQQAGHRPIAVVGGGTAMVGDPSGKDEARQLLTSERIEHNKSCLKRQLGLFLEFGEGQGALIDNADWLLDLNYVSFLRDIGKHFSVNQMLGKASVKLRLERGLSFLEFNYQLLQAYDFLELRRRHGCVLQMGGDDQWGNITAGIDLIRKVEGTEAHGLTFPLVTTSSGRKMGKTAAGSVWLDPARLSPYDYFQYWINVDDADVGRFLRLFTFLPLARIAALERLTGADVRRAKQVLALEATSIVHGPTEAGRALEGARAAFGGGTAVHAMKTVTMPLPAGVLDALVASELCKSRGDARRKIREGAVRIGMDRAAITSEDLAITLDMLDASGGVVLWRGKKTAVRMMPT